MCESGIELCQCSGEGGADRRKVPDQFDCDISQYLATPGLHGRNLGHSVRERDNVGGDAMTLTRPDVQTAFLAVLQRLRQRFSKRDAVLNAGVHPLSSGRAMDMRCVATEEDVAGARRLCDAMVNMK